LIGGGFSQHSSYSQSSVVRNRHGSGSSGEGTPTRRPLSHDHALSLHLLNDRLEKYIKKIELNPEGNRCTVSVNEIQDAKGLDIESLQEYHEWMEMCRKLEMEEAELAKLKTENEALKFENSSIKSGNDRIEQEIHSFEQKIRQMRQEIEELKAKYQYGREELERERMSKEHSLDGAFGFIQELPFEWKERNTNILVNNARASIFDEKRRFIDSVNSRDWEEEKTTQSFDKAKIRAEIKEQYDRRLREELEKLRAEYDEFFKYVNMSTKKIYEDKLNELKKKMSEMTPDERREVEDILRKLKESKDRIKDLELEKLKLTQKERSLTESLEEDEAYWKAMLDEKKRELAWLQEQFHSLEFAYREFSKNGGVSKEEVKRYSDLIQQTRVSQIKTHAELFYDGKTIHESSSSSSSSSSSEDEDDAFKKPPYH